MSKELDDAADDVGVRFRPTEKIVLTRKSPETLITEMMARIAVLELRVAELEKKAPPL